MSHTAFRSSHLVAVVHDWHVTQVRISHLREEKFEEI